ncbi:MAG: hypothetical protein JWN23_1426 [Rhodocyclales bacterium]|nr:hypothetical protein [Rhodocyclales bacterium]
MDGAGAGIGSGSGWFWFNSDAKVLPYLYGYSGTGPTYTFDTPVAPSGSKFITSTVQGQTPAFGTYNATLQAAVANTGKGAIRLDKSSGSSTVPSSTNGGWVVFKLPSVSGFQVDVAATGNICYSIETSPDGTTWTNQYGIGGTGVGGGTPANQTDKCSTSSRMGTAGEATGDAGTNISSTSPIFVRIMNKGSGSLTVYGVKITL